MLLPWLMVKHVRVSIDDQGTPYFVIMDGEAAPPCFEAAQNSRIWAYAAACFLAYESKEYRHGPSVGVDHAGGEIAAGVTQAGRQRA